MKQTYILFLISCLFFVKAEAGEVASAVTDRLVQMGMENVRADEDENILCIAYEDNVYRGTYRGLAAVIGSLLKEDVIHTAVHLVVLENRIPQITVHIPSDVINDYRDKKIDWQQVVAAIGISYDTAADMQQLGASEAKSANRSAGKIDLVLYPQVSLTNAWMDKLYGTIINIAPAVEVGLWKGASFTGQVIFPIWNNMKGQMDYIRPGMLVLRQELRLPHNLFATLSAGHFNAERMGVEASLLYRLNNDKWAFGVDAGLTGSSTFYGGHWELSKWKRVTGFALIRYNEPRYHLEFDLRAQRFIFGDYGLRADCTRHFGEVSVGLFAMYTDGEANGGFHFAVPLPRRKRSNRRAVRVRLPEYFNWEYQAQSGNDYAARRLGRTFETRPDENHSRTYYNPDFIRDNLMRMGDHL